MKITVFDDRLATDLPPLDLASVDLLTIVKELRPDHEAWDVKVDLVFTTAAEESVTHWHHPMPPVSGAPGAHIHILVKPKEEATDGTLRALNRALAREVFYLHFALGTGDLSKYANGQEFAAAATNFADGAPQPIVKAVTA